MKKFPVPSFQFPVQGSLELETGYWQLATDLEIYSERELRLSRRAQSDGSANRAGECSERSGGSVCVRLSGLHAIGLGQRVVRNRLWQRADRVREVHSVEEVEDLGPEFEVSRARKREVLRQHQVDLLEVGTVDRIALEIAERA